MVRKIEVDFVETMRYPTCGDYFEEEGVMKVKVYNQNDEKKNLCIALHEIIEAFATKWHGIKEEEITEFDIRYELNRTESISEPGDDPKSPYRNEHRFSENIERQCAFYFGIDWIEYNDNLKVYHEYNV